MMPRTKVGWGCQTDFLRWKNALFLRWRGASVARAKAQATVFVLGVKKARAKAEATVCFCRGTRQNAGWSQRRRLSRVDDWFVMGWWAWRWSAAEVRVRGGVKPSCAVGCWYWRAVVMGLALVLAAQHLRSRARWWLTCRGSRWSPGGPIQPCEWRCGMVTR